MAEPGLAPGRAASSSGEPRPAESAVFRFLVDHVDAQDRATWARHGGRAAFGDKVLITAARARSHGRLWTHDLATLVYARVDARCETALKLWMEIEPQLRAGTWTGDEAQVIALAMEQVFLKVRAERDTILAIVNDLAAGQSVSNGRLLVLFGAERPRPTTASRRGLRACAPRSRRGRSRSHRHGGRRRRSRPPARGDDDCDGEPAGPQPRSESRSRRPEGWDR